MIDEQPLVEEQSGSRVVDFLDAIESVVVGGRHVVFTPNVMVNEDEVLDLIDRARHALPDDVKLAHHIVDQQRELVEAADAAASELRERSRSESEALIATAQQQAQAAREAAVADAQRIAQEAQAHAARLVNQHAITLAAKEHAAGVNAQAAERAERFRRESEAYARGLFIGLEQHVTKTQTAVRRALERLPAE